MNWVDFAILGIIALSSIVSLVRGFVKEAVSLIVWLSAFFVASNFYPQVATFLTQIENPMWQSGAAIAILFVATILVGSLINYTLGQLVQVSGLSGTDRVLGMVFGGLRGILIVSAVLFFVDTFTTLAKSDIWQASILIPEFDVVIQWFFEYVQQNSSFLQPSAES